MHVTVKPIKTILGKEFAVIVSAWYGLKTKVSSIHMTASYAESEAKRLARQLKIKYKII
jgi:hypothetical protein